MSHLFPRFRIGGFLDSLVRLAGLWVIRCGSRVCRAQSRGGARCVLGVGPFTLRRAPRAQLGGWIGEQRRRERDVGIRPLLLNQKTLRPSYNELI